MQRTGIAPTRDTQPAIVELRQYTLRPGKRDVLIGIFERNFIEAQEKAGARIVGQFRDLDNPDRFVWLRGFPDLPSRPRALEGFYSSATWKAHREAVNELLIDYDNVLLLRPARPDAAFPTAERLAPAGGDESERLVLATIYSFSASVADDFLEFFDRVLEPALNDNGARCLGAYVTEPSANNYPSLPVREGEHVFVWFMRFPNQAAYQDHCASLNDSQTWRSAAAELERRLNVPAQTLRLAPTSRSALA